MIDQININDIQSIMNEAGRAIMDIYTKDFDVQLKDDNSPLTLADQHSNNIIISRLKELYPDTPFISEETKHTSYDERKNWEYFWLIDPLDGTKEFVKKNGEFTINIALIHRNKPVLGMVGVPAKELIYYAIKDIGSYKIKKKHKPKKIWAKKEKDENKLTVVGSRSHGIEELNKFIDKKKNQYRSVELISVGSALKFCLVAEGGADVYIRTGRTMEWDTAAGHIVAEESGKRVKIFNSDNPLIYNKEDLSNPWFIVE